MKNLHPLIKHIIGISILYIFPLTLVPAGAYFASTVMSGIKELAFFNSAINHSRLFLSDLLAIPILLGSGFIVYKIYSGYGTKMILMSENIYDVFKSIAVYAGVNVLAGIVFRLIFRNILIIFGWFF